MCAAVVADTGETKVIRRLLAAKMFPCVFVMASSSFVLWPHKAKSGSENWNAGKNFLSNYSECGKPMGQVVYFGALIIRTGIERVAMASAPPQEVTQLLQAWSRGEKSSLEKLTP